MIFLVSLNKTFIRIPIPPAGAEHVFEAMDSDPTLVKTIDAQSPVSRLLQLKVGAQVSARWRDTWVWSGRTRRV